MTKPICIYHGNCVDGFTAAWAVWKRFGDTWDYHAGVYQNPPPDVTGRDVVLVDFSYKRNVLRGMAKQARSILVLDHHKTAADDLHASDGTDEDGPHVRRLAALPTWDQHMQQTTADDGHGVPYCEIYAYFDMESSGAGIAWDFFHPDPKGVPPKQPRLVAYAQDRDLWRFVLPRSRDVNAWIFSHEYSFDMWDAMARDLEGNYPRCADEGAAIERKHHKDVRELTQALKRRMVIGGHEVWAASLPYTLTSDAGHLMATGEPFAACYWDTPEGRVFSLRSTDEGLDVSEIAKAYGGGGHRNAAGFRLPHGVNP